MQWSDPRKLNFEGLEMQKRNVLMDIAQKEDFLKKKKKKVG